MTARRIAREIAVIMMPQLPKDRKRLEKLEFDTLLCRSVQILSDYARQCLSEASSYLHNANEELEEFELNHPDNSRQISDVQSVNLNSEELRRQIELLQIASHLIEEALDIPEICVASDYLPESVSCNNCGHKQKLHLRRPSSGVAKEFVESLLGTFLDHHQEIDEIITTIKSKWRIDRMVSIDRDILRLACAEAFYMEDVPVKVAISEAVELAHRFADERAAKFINGVLADLAIVADRFRQTGELNFEPISDEESGRSQKNDAPVGR
jgi:N utilization substance protein B